MLHKDVDFTPLSPKKAHVAHLGVGHARTSTGTPEPRLRYSTMASDNSLPGRRVSGDETEEDEDAVRTTEQKKAFLGTMLDNVDGLVEGVRSAGVWGL